MITVYKSKLYGWEDGQEVSQIYAKDGTLYNAYMNQENNSPTFVNLAPVLAADKIRLKTNNTEYPSADIQCIVTDGNSEQVITSIRLTVDQLAGLYKDMYKFKKNLSDIDTHLTNKFDLS